MQHCAINYFAIEKDQKGRSQQKLGTGMTGGGKFEPPYSPPPFSPPLKQRIVPVFYDQISLGIV